MTVAFGNFFQDFTPGQVIRHGTPRTVTDGDAAVYTALTGCREAAPSADTTARLCGLPRRPLDDWLVFNMAFGKTVRDISHNAIANLGYAEVRFLRPVYAGSTLRSETNIIGLREIKSRHAGIVHVRSVCFDETDVPLLSWVRWVMVQNSAEERENKEHVAPAVLQTIPADTLFSHATFPGVDAVRDWCRATGSSKLWADYAVGDRIEHPSGMTIEEADHMSAARLYQNTAQVHFRSLTASDGNVGRRIVYGGHVISLCYALSYDGLENRIHVAAVNAGAHKAPVFAGDVLHAISVVIDRQPASGRTDIGLLRLRLIGVKGRMPTNSDFDAPSDSSIVLELDYWAVMPCSLR
jgi:2-methylfumaryl-CoA hydratase